MKRIVTLALVGAALVGTASSASADHRWRHRDRVTVIERQGPDVGGVLGALLLGQVISQMTVRQDTFQEPFQQPFQPKLQDPLRAPPPLK